MAGVKFEVAEMIGESPSKRSRVSYGSYLGQLFDGKLELSLRGVELAEVPMQLAPRGEGTVWILQHGPARHPSPRDRSREHRGGAHGVKPR